MFAYSNYENLATSLSAGALNLQHVYCIVGSGTASASELVINSLKGIDVEVTLIGKRTTGKNVGMEPVEYTIRNNVYEVVPITFQIYNAKGVGDYENGFTPDIEIDENDPYGRGDGYTETMVRIKSSYMPVPSRKSPVKLRYPQHAVQKP